VFLPFLLLALAFLPSFLLIAVLRETAVAIH